MIDTGCLFQEINTADLLNEQKQEKTLQDLWQQAEISQEITTEQT